MPTIRDSGRTRQNFAQLARFSNIVYLSANTKKKKKTHGGAPDTFQTRGVVGLRGRSRTHAPFTNHDVTARNCRPSRVLATIARRTQRLLRNGRDHHLITCTSGVLTNLRGVARKIRMLGLLAFTSQDSRTTHNTSRPFKEN